MRFPFVRLWAVRLCLLSGALCPSVVRSQDAPALTLADALAIAQDRSEAVDIARAGVRSAQAEQLRARAQFLPQISGNAGYARTLASQFEDLFRFGGGGDQQGGDFEEALPFGRTNTYTFGLTASQAVFTGGRISAQGRLADALHDAAELELDSTNAQFMLDVSTAFYDAALADQMAAIARSALADAEETLKLVRLGHQVGRLPEFDVLRAAVSRTNQLPTVARRDAEREQAYLRFKQLLDVPAAARVSLRADLNEDELPVPEPFRERFHASEALERERVAVRQAEASVRQREANLDIAASQRWPSIGIYSDFGLFAYPNTLFPTSADQFRRNWTVGAQLQVPILNFGRIRADVLSARADLDQALAQRRLTRELASLDTNVVLSQLRTAQEQWKAVTGGVEEARRAYEIADLRYRQGISSQLELNDARLALQIAQSNRAQAARDLQVARITVALLPLLPISVGAQAPSQTRPLQMQQSQQQFGGQGGNPFANRPAAGATRAAPTSSGIPGVPAGQVGVPDTGRPMQ